MSSDFVAIKGTLDNLLSQPHGVRGIHPPENGFYEPEEFHSAVLRYLGALSSIPGAIEKLTDYGAFIQRKTATGTEHHRVWRLGYAHLLKITDPSAFDWRPPSLNPVLKLRKLSGQEWSLSNLNRKRTLIKEILDNCEISDEVAQALTKWWNITNGLVTTGENSHADGCRILLEIHRDGIAGAVANGIRSNIFATVLAERVQAAARFLAEELEANGGSPDGGDKMLLLTEAKRVFGFKSTKELDCFLENHPEVKQDRPLTKGGTPHSRRRIISVLGLCRAISQDDKILSDPARKHRMETRLHKAGLHKRLEEEALAFFTGENR